MVQFQMNALLDKSQSDDPDLRFMALTDLITECTSVSNFVIDEYTETRLVDMVLRLMEDNNGEVKNAGVKALSAFCPKLRPIQLAKVIDQLTNLSSGSSGQSEDSRDVASLALKTMTSQLAEDSTVAGIIVERLPTKLLAQLKNSALPPQQTLETLDILSDLFTRFRPLVLSNAALQKEALRVLVGLVTDGRIAVKKKAIVTLGALIPSSSSGVFSALSSTVLDALKSGATSSEVRRTYISLVGTLAKSSPAKVGGVLKDVMPSVLEVCKADEDEDDEAAEAREVGLQTLEILILKCPTEITPFINQILQVSSTLVVFDPNYAGDDEDDEMDAEEEEGENGDDEEDEEEEEEEYDDDEDSSWKTRRSAAKVIGAVVSTRSELLAVFYRSLFPIMSSRLSEREESVRLEIFSSISTLLHQTGVFVKAEKKVIDAAELKAQLGGMSPASLKRKREEMDDTGRTDVKMDDADIEIDEDSPLALLEPQVSALLKRVQKQLAAKSVYTKQAAFTLLRELTTVLSGGLDEHAPALLSKAADSLTISGTPAMTTEALSFLGAFFSLHPVAVYQAALPALVKRVVQLTHDKVQKISAEAIAVLSELTRSIRRDPATPLPADLPPVVEQIFSATVALFKGGLADVDVRIKAVETLSDVVYYVGDVLAAQLPVALDQLNSALNNDSLRLTGVRGVQKVARSQVIEGQKVQQWLRDVVQVLPGTLRKGSRTYKGEGFRTLEAILTRLGDTLPVEAVPGLVLDLQPFITESDLYNLPLALNVVTILLNAQPASKSAVESEVLPLVFALVRTPLITGLSLDAVLAFFEALITPDQELALKVIPELLKIVGKEKTLGNAAGGDGQATRTTAKCVGVIVKASPRDRAGIIAEFAKQIESPKATEPSKYLALHSLGEIGRAVDMSANLDIFNRILSYFGDSSPVLRDAAAFAAGNMAVGSPKFLQPIVSQVESATDPNERLLALQALRESIFHCSRSQLEHIADTLWKPLFDDSEIQEEATRSIVASCIGKLTTSNPAKYLPQLENKIQSTSAATRTTVASAIRYTFTDTAASYDDILAPFIVEFLSLMHDVDLGVRKVSLGSLNAAAQHKPQLIREHLGTLLPLLYGETEVKKELIRVVQMGPWKQTFDDGLETRKTAFETMYTLLDTCLGRIDIPVYLQRVVAGLSDADEIKVICFLSLARLAHVAPAPVTQILDNVSDSFTETMKAFVGGKDTVKQEFDRKAEIQRSALRTIYQLSKLSSPATSPKFDALITSVRNGEYRTEWEELSR